MGSTSDKPDIYAHPVLTHRDGTHCIWIAGTGWFVPLDVGGEGFICENPEHEEMSSDIR